MPRTRGEFDLPRMSDDSSPERGMLAPDLFGLIPASFFGPAPGMGRLPRRGVLLYNAWHTFAAPIADLFRRTAALRPRPVAAAGMAPTHQRGSLLGFRLRREDGGQAVF
ncbi:MAG TPA: hypothetical protein VGR46_10360 [Candidatus Limnocylindria bacterium]|nr:hypothetical protein [Candidatus Limnocylindria bacterium]